MNDILSSASKIAFLLVVFTVCVSFGLGKLTEKPFVELATMAFIYYFVKPKNDQPGGEVK